jgi:hypothetical protein
LSVKGLRNDGSPPVQASFSPRGISYQLSAISYQLSAIIPTPSDPFAYGCLSRNR